MKHVMQGAFPSTENRQASVQVKPGDVIEILFRNKVKSEVLELKIREEEKTGIVQSICREREKKSINENKAEHFTVV